MIEMLPAACFSGIELESKYAAERRMVEARLNSEAWGKFEAIEEELVQLPQSRPPLNHIFTPGLYVRECFLPKGHIFTTRIHLTEHPFVISIGVVSIWSEEDGLVTLRAPYTGVTKAGTRRFLYAYEDTIFSTFHVTDKTDPDEVEREITYCGGKYRELGLAAATPAERLLCTT